MEIVIHDKTVPLFKKSNIYLENLLKTIDLNEKKT